MFFSFSAPQKLLLLKSNAPSGILRGCTFSPMRILVRAVFAASKNNFCRLHTDHTCIQTCVKMCAQQRIAGMGRTPHAHRSLPTCARRPSASPACALTHRASACPSSKPTACPRIAFFRPNLPPVTHTAHATFEKLHLQAHFRKSHEQLVLAKPRSDQITSSVEASFFVLYFLTSRDSGRREGPSTASHFPQLYFHTTIPNAHLFKTFLDV